MRFREEEEEVFIHSLESGHALQQPPSIDVLNQSEQNILKCMSVICVYTYIRINNIYNINTIYIMYICIYTSCFLVFVFRF